MLLAKTMHSAHMRHTRPIGRKHMWRIAHRGVAKDFSKGGGGADPTCPYATTSCIYSSLHNRTPQGTVPKWSAAYCMRM